MTNRCSQLPVNMSVQETPKDDHKGSPAEASQPPKRSTIRNILKSFPTPSMKNIKGFQHMHGGKGPGGGTTTSKDEGSLLSEGAQTVGVTGGEPQTESCSNMPNQEKEDKGEERGGVGSAEDITHSFSSNSTLPYEGGEEQRSETASQDNIKHNSDVLEQGSEKQSNIVSQHKFDTNPEIPYIEDEEEPTDSHHNLDSNLTLLNQGEKEEGEEGGGGSEGGETSASHLNSNTPAENVHPSTSSKDRTLETSITEDKTSEPVTHTFSFHLSHPQQDPEHHPDSSSESQPQTSSTLNLQQTHTPTSKPRTRTKKQKGLSSTKDARDSDSSVASRKRSSKNKTKIKSKFAPGSLEYIEEQLCGRIFSGWVEERQWVESVGGYRDVIEVDEWEVEMNQQLQTIISSIPGVQDGTRWINITPPDKNPYYCLWVLLEAPPVPGHYWYTVTGTRLQPQFGLMISVKKIRSIHPHDGELAEARRKRLKRKSKGEAQTELESVSDVLQDWLDQFTNLRPATVLSSITSTLTLSNLKEALRFLTVLIMTLVLGLVTFLRESHMFGLRFVREVGIFFHNATPFLQTLLGFFEKIVGGLYLLVAMVYRDFRRPSVPPPRFPPPPPPPLTSSPPRPSTGPRAIQYVSPERWVVKTQNNDFT